MKRSYDTFVTKKQNKQTENRLCIYMRRKKSTQTHSNRSDIQSIHSQSNFSKWGTQTSSIQLSCIVEAARRNGEEEIPTQCPNLSKPLSSSRADLENSRFKGRNPTSTQPVSTHLSIIRFREPVGMLGKWFQIL